MVRKLVRNEWTRRQGPLGPGKVCVLQFCKCHCLPDGKKLCVFSGSYNMYLSWAHCFWHWEKFFFCDKTIFVLVINLQKSIEHCNYQHLPVQSSSKVFFCGEQLTLKAFSALFSSSCAETIPSLFLSRVLKTAECLECFSKSAFRIWRIWKGPYMGMARSTYPATGIGDFIHFL